MCSTCKYKKRTLCEDHSFSEHVLSGGFNNGCGFSDELISNTELLEGSTEVLHDSIEMDVLEIHSLVSISHVLALVSVGTTKKHSEEIALLADLMWHVGVLEEVLDSRVSEDLLVEDRDGSIDSSLASESSEN